VGRGPRNWRDLLGGGAEPIKWKGMGTHKKKGKTSAPCGTQIGKGKWEDGSGGVAKEQEEKGGW